MIFIIFKTSCIYWIYFQARLDIDDETMNKKCCKTKVETYIHHLIHTCWCILFTGLLWCNEVPISIWFTRALSLHCLHYRLSEFLSGDSHCQLLSYVRRHGATQRHLRNWPWCSTSFFQVPVYNSSVSGIMITTSQKALMSNTFLYPPRTKFRGVYRNHSVGPSVCLSVHLSVQIPVRPITFLWFDIGSPYLAHGCITIRQCVAYIHDPDSMLTFDLKVKFKGFCHVFMYDL